MGARFLTTGVLYQLFGTRYLIAGNARQGVIGLNSRPDATEDGPWNSNSTGAQHEMQDQGNYRKHQQQVN